MLPEVQAWLDVAEKYRAEIHRLWAEYPDYESDIDAIPDEELATWAQTTVARELEWRKIRREHNERKAAALEGLANSSNPLVAWIANERTLIEGYQPHTDKLLVALPLSREELLNFPATQGWDGIFTEQFNWFMGLADEAGVLPA